MMQTIKMTVNGQVHEVSIDIRETLQEVLRHRLQLTGLKIGCGVGECGACTVLFNGKPVDTCIMMAIQANGADIVTVEGLADEHGEINSMQRAFIEHGAVQCGFCTSGLVVTASKMAETGKRYTRDEIKREIAGNLCRCTGYQHVVDAIESVVGAEKE